MQLLLFGVETLDGQC